MPSSFPLCYFQKKVIKIEKAVVPIQAKALQYGLGCFSGIRGFYNKDKKNLYLFRPQDHFKRLEEAAKILGMKLKLTYPQFEKIVKELLQKNKAKEDIYVRTTLYAASTKLTPRFDNSDDDVCIYILSLKDYYGADNGLNCCVSSWRRIDDDVISVKAKSTGTYAGSGLAKTEALLNGYDEPIYLNRSGHVSEASSANIFGVKDGVVWTPPLSANILNGITRRSLLELMRNEMDLEVREENFDRSMLYTMDELFLSGTAAKVSWIREVDHRKIGTGKLGPITKKLSELYNQASSGNLPKYSQWCVPMF